MSEPKRQAPAHSTIVRRGSMPGYEGALQRMSLPSGLSWKDVASIRKHGVTVETVARFKGLEGEILILWGLDGLPNEERSETLYVGISRAKSVLALCGRDETCSNVLEGA